MAASANKILNYLDNVESASGSKRKLSDGEESKSKKLQLCELSSLESLSDATVLNVKEGEFVFLKAKVKNEEAIVKIRKSMPKSEELMKDIGKFTLENTFANKAWAGYKASFPASGFQVDVYCPSQITSDKEEIQKLLSKQVKKLTAKQLVFVRETAQRYENVTKPYIDGLPEKHVSWVYNIIDNVTPDVTAECYDIIKDDGDVREKIIYSDPNEKTGFALCVDLKWRQHPKSMKELAEKPVKDGKAVYGILFPIRKDIRSLRDLRGEHLPFLRNVESQSKAAMQKLYNVPESNLRLFVHYQPQYYFFHVHVTSMDVNFGIEAEKGHLLETIISNLEIDPEYYKKVTLVYKVPKDSDLAKMHEAN